MNRTKVRPSAIQPATTRGGVSILLVEDDADSAAAIKHYLQEIHIIGEIEVAARLNDALTLLNETNRFDLILTDLSLPDSRGVRTVVQLLADGPTIPVVVLSGTDEREIASLAVKLGAQDFIAKSEVDRESLARSIEYSIARYRAQVDLHQILRKNPDGILVVGSNNMVVFANPAASRLLGKGTHEIIGKVLDFAVEDQTAFETRVGTGTWVEVRWEPTQWNRLAARVVSLRDISDRKAASDRLAFMANFDQLTGLSNRSWLRNRLAKEVEWAVSNKLAFSVIAIDLDQFKDVNRAHGYSTGNQVLANVAQTIGESANGADVPARVGDDEFVLIARESPNLGEATALAKRLIDELAKPHSIGTESITVTASVGVAMYPDDGDTVDTLLQAADVALQTAKRQGRNRVCSTSSEA